MDRPAIVQLVRRASLRQLQVFEAIARHRSFRKAAEELFLAQPTVSMQVKKVSEAIGLPLFEQIGKRVYLTEAGEALYDACREIFGTLSRLDMQFADMKGLKHGHLRLAVVTTAKYFVPRVLGIFCQRYPGIEASLKVTNRERMLQRIAENEDDLYILGEPPELPDAQFQPFLPNRLEIVAPRNHPLLKLRNVPLAHIAKEPFIMREEGSGTRMAVERLFRDRGLALNIRMELGSNEAIKQSVLGGLGISALSRHAFGLEGATGQLGVVDAKGFPLSWDWSVGYARGKQLSVVAATFLEFLLKESHQMAEISTIAVDESHRRFGGAQVANGCYSP